MTVCRCFCQATHPLTATTMACVNPAAGDSGRVIGSKLAGPALAPLCGACMAIHDELAPPVSGPLARFLPFLEQSIHQQKLAQPPPHSRNPALFLWFPHLEKAGALSVDDAEWAFWKQDLPTLLDGITGNWPLIRAQLPMTDVIAQQFGAVILLSYSSEPERDMRSCTVWEHGGASATICRYLDGEHPQFPGGPPAGEIGEGLALLLHRIRST